MVAPDKVKPADDPLHIVELFAVTTGLGLTKAVALVTELQTPLLPVMV